MCRWKREIRINVPHLNVIPFFWCGAAPAALQGTTTKNLNVLTLPDLPAPEKSAENKRRRSNKSLLSIYQRTHLKWNMILAGRSSPAVLSHFNWVLLIICSRRCHSFPKKKKKKKKKKKAARRLRDTTKLFFRRRGIQESRLFAFCLAVCVWLSGHRGVSAQTRRIWTPAGRLHATRCYLQDTFLSSKHKKFIIPFNYN